MPNNGTLLSIATIGVVSALLIFITIRMKRSKVLTRVPYQPQTGTPRTAQRATTPTPTTTPAQQPAVPAQPATTQPAPATPRNTAPPSHRIRNSFQIVLGTGLAIGVVFLVMMALVAFAEYYKNTPTGGVATTTTNVSTRSKYFVGRTHYLSEIMDFWWADEDLNIEDPVESWNMVDTFKMESPGGRQFNDDGTIFRGSNPNDIGLGQINLIESRDEIREAGCDLEDPACQFKVIRIVYKKYGHKRWLAYPRVLALDVVKTPIEAPVGTCSEPVPIEQGSSCMWEVDREVMAVTDEGVKLRFEPNKIPRFNAKSLAYCSNDGLPAKVTISCRKLP